MALQVKALCPHHQLHTSVHINSSSQSSPDTLPTLVPRHVLFPLSRISRSAHSLFLAQVMSLLNCHYFRQTFPE